MPMQEGLSRNWINKQNRLGVFEEFTVMGHIYESQDGETGWHITAWQSGRGPVHAYWVSGHDFFAASLHIDYRTRIEVRQNFNSTVSRRNKQLSSKPSENGDSQSSRNKDDATMAV
jgi:hypothetical protein